MSNQKTTQLRLLSAGDVAPGDRIPIVDVSELTSPTGETKGILVNDLASYMVNSGGLSLPFQSFQTVNGLAFDGFTTPVSDPNLCCYTSAPSLGTTFTISVRASINTILDSNYRVLFGAGQSLSNIVGQPHSAYIGVIGRDLVGVVFDGSISKVVTYPSFFSPFNNKPFCATLTKDLSNNLSLYINGTLFSTVTGATPTINSTFFTMGCGNNTVENLDAVIYEAHAYQTALHPDEIIRMFLGGISNHSSLVSSYRPALLNDGPSQWLDAVGNHHLLLPISGAKSIAPSKEFHLRFTTTGSGYLGNGTVRDVLPPNYILNSCFLYSSGKPLLTVGSTPDVAPPGASGIYSWNNNRVPLVSASYSRNNLPLLDLGIAHTDRSLYVFFSASAAPCTFSFDGYISEYGPVTYTP